MPSTTFSVCTTVDRTYRFHCESGVIGDINDCHTIALAWSPFRTCCLLAKWYTGIAQPKSEQGCGFRKRQVLLGICSLTHIDHGCILSPSQNCLTSPYELWCRCEDKMECTAEIANLAAAGRTYPAAYALVAREPRSIWDTTRAIEPWVIWEPFAILSGDRAIERHYIGFLNGGSWLGMHPG
jgi:hypothetical protein